MTKATMPDTPSSVTQTLRKSIRHGEDFTTIESTITVGPEATPEQIAKLIEIGLEIYRQQTDAADAQEAEIRATATITPPATPRIREPEAEASKEQRKLIDRIAFEDLGWAAEDLDDYALEQGITDFAQLTKGQASAMIDALKKIKDEEKQEREQRPQLAANTPKGPGRAPIPAPKMAAARAALAQAEQHAGVGTQGPVIREPNSPASESQVQRIVREIIGRNDRSLRTIATRIAAALDVESITLEDIKKLGTVAGVRAFDVTKAQASALIRLFTPPQQQAVA